jgi:hemoglobin
MATRFEKYGGFAKVSRFVSTFYDKVLDSPTLAPYFADADMRRLIDHQTKFMAQAMGGPVSYSDTELERVHTRLQISNDAFDEMNALLREALEDCAVAEDDIEAICKEMASRRSVIVSR